MDVINGYNHNIKYKDNIFHIQTEDSGADKAHVITHLYFGGNIINSQKTSYADLLAEPDWRKKVVDLMQSMHKNMMKGLIRGNFDDRIAERSAGAHFLNGPAPLNVDAGSQHRSSLGIGGSMTSKPAEAAAPATPAAAPAAPKTPSLIPVPTTKGPVTFKSPVAASADPVFPAAAALAPLPQMPAIAPAPVQEAKPEAAVPAASASCDGTFQVEGNMFDLLCAAAATISSEDLAKALDNNDDSLLFGEEKKEEARLDDMMLSFLGGLGG